MREEEDWLNPEADEMAVTAELGDRLLLSLLDDTVAEVLRVRALSRSKRRGGSGVNGNSVQLHDSELDRNGQRVVGQNCHHSLR